MPSKFAKDKQKDWTRPTGRLPQFWSFTRYNAWTTCHARYAFQHVWKIRTPDNRAMERGGDIHTKSERYVNGDIRGIPKELMQFRQEYAAIKKLPCKAEESYTVTKTWQPTFPTDWDNAWLRAKVDIEVLQPEIALLTIIDVKTGKEYPAHEPQSEIYGTIGFVVHPEVEQIDFEYWYVDNGEVGEYTFMKGDLRAKKKEWKDKVRPMLTMKVFKPQPENGNCKYCPFRSDKEMRDGEAGPCHAWK